VGHGATDSYQWNTPWLFLVLWACIFLESLIWKSVWSALANYYLNLTWIATNFLNAMLSQTYLYPIFRLTSTYLKCSLALVMSNNPRKMPAKTATYTHGPGPVPHIGRMVPHVLSWNEFILTFRHNSNNPIFSLFPQYSSTCGLYLGEMDSHRAERTDRWSIWQWESREEGDLAQSSITAPKSPSCQITGWMDEHFLESTGIWGKLRSKKQRWNLSTQS
jgi:hypothetical protein